MRPFRLFLLPVLLLSMSGCAFTDINLTLPTESASARSGVGRNRQVIIVMPFVDDREIVGRCGMQKNGYNMDTADAVCAGEPAPWLADELAQALRHAGFDVLNEGASHRASAVRVEGSLLKIFVEPVIGFWSGSLEADLSARVVVTSDSGLEADRTFFVKGWRGGQMLSITPAYNTALERATNLILEEMVNALIELMDEYPELGMNLPQSPIVKIALGFGGNAS